jgi:two-component system phosphate regulon response regulator OmpR
MTGEWRVLVVDDDAEVRQLLQDYLGAHGCRVQGCADSAALRQALQLELPDLVLLDVGLPGEDGLSLARFLREHHDLAVIMISGAGTPLDRIIGLEVGADDYLAKPFDPRELLARVKSVLRRVQARPTAAGALGSAETTPAEPEPTRRQPFGRCDVEVESRRLFDRLADDQEVPMTAMEYDLIRVFLANPNRVLSRDQLLQRTRNRDWEPFDRSIDIRIGRLRRKVEPDPGSEPRVIRTVRIAGYMYVPDGSN